MDALAPRTAEQVEEAVCEVFFKDRVQQRLVKQLVEVCKCSRKDHVLRPERVIRPVSPPQPSKSVVEARRPGIAKHSATTAATAVDSRVAEMVDDARPPGIAKTQNQDSQCPSVKVNLLGPEQAARPVQPKAAVAKSAVEARPLGAAKYRATTESELTESSGEFADVAKAVGKARPLGFAKCRATTKSQSLLESFPLKLVELGFPARGVPCVGVRFRTGVDGKGRKEGAPPTFLNERQLCGDFFQVTVAFFLSHETPTQSP